MCIRDSLHLVARSEKRQFVEKFVEALLQVEGAYAFVGLTNKKMVGAREVHMRISSPPIMHPDFYGIDTPDQAMLLAAACNGDVEAMRRFIGADSLAFISVDGIYKAMGYEGRDNAHPQFTDHCFTGEYPTRLRDREGPPQQKQLSFLAEVG